MRRTGIRPALIGLRTVRAVASALLMAGLPRPASMLARIANRLAAAVERRYRRR